MADLAIAQRAALAQLLAKVPDTVLGQLAAATDRLPGDDAQLLQIMIAAEERNRARRHCVFGVLAPMFRPRPDGVHSVVFPSAVLSRLWTVAAARESDLLGFLDMAEADPDDAFARTRLGIIAGRIGTAAAAAVRDEPETIWPQTEAPETRAKGLVELAGCCDLISVVGPRLHALKAWVGRPDQDELAEFRLLVRDCGDIAPDGVGRLLEILFAHLGEAALILRLVVNTSPASSREAFLAQSELTVFVDRLIAAVQDRAERIAAFQPPAGESLAIKAFRDDLVWCADVLTELNAAVHPRPESRWGLDIADVRQTIGAVLEKRLAAVTRPVSMILPMMRVQTAGRMTRQVPDLRLAIPAENHLAATDALAMVRAMRGPASTFGCEAVRGQLVRTLTADLTDYANLVLDALNSEDAVNESVAQDRMAMVSGCLDQIEAIDEARTLRRRAAVAGPAAAAGADRHTGSPGGT